MRLQKFGIPALCSTAVLGCRTLCMCVCVCTSTLHQLRDQLTIHACLVQGPQIINIWTLAWDTCKKRKDCTFTHTNSCTSIEVSSSQTYDNCKIDKRDLFL